MLSADVPSRMKEIVLMIVMIIRVVAFLDDDYPAKLASVGRWKILVAGNRRVVLGR